MDLMLVVVGLFILAAILKNEELRDLDKNREKFGFLAGPVALFLILGGLGFIMPSSMANFPHYSFLLFFVGALAVISATTEGRVKVISRVGWAAVLSFAIMGSFM